MSTPPSRCAASPKRRGAAAATLRSAAVAVALVAAAAAWDPTLPYRLSAAASGVRGMLRLEPSEIDACLEAYEYFELGTSEFAVQSTAATATETEHVRAYYAVASSVLAVADIEKMYIPPLLLANEGLYANQMELERGVFDALGASSGSKLLDVGCGRGRVAHHAATHTGAHVSGFNIDASQIESAVEHAAETGMSDRLAFSQGDHHNPFAYPDNAFDGSYSFQAVWPFFKEHELDSVAKEIFRVLKPGAAYACSEYLLTPHFDRSDEEHLALHRLFLPTLAATQSNYPSAVVAALERAGFEVELSAPSVAPAWPLTDQKTTLIRLLRFVAASLAHLNVAPHSWVKLLDNLLKGGAAWMDAEKRKLADLNWRIRARKPNRTVIRDDSIRHQGGGDGL